MLHPRFGEIDDYIAEQAKDPSSDFDNVNRETRVSDWRTYVGERVAAMWAALPYDTRIAIALDAQDRASNEEWD